MADFSTDMRAAEVAEGIHGYLLNQAVSQGVFVKSIGSTGVDGSLLGVMVPFAVVDLKDVRGMATLQRIKDDLFSEQGGLRRYIEDSYYGGGGWLPLTAWLGWVEFLQGDRASAIRRLAWIEARAAPNGHLPEQVAGPATDVEKISEWVERWGPPASPLLWSHAKYIILHSLIRG
jgi:GH15 family glucan-1,4-alpha-glucosidase